MSRTKYIIMNWNGLSAQTPEGDAERQEWVGKKVHSKLGTEYCIIKFCWSPFAEDFPMRYSKKGRPYGVWLQRTDGTYQMRFLTVTQYNQVMVLDKKAKKC